MKILTRVLLFSLLLTDCNRQRDIKIAFNDGEILKHSFSVASINPDLPSDWTDYKYMILTFQASSPQKFEVGLRNPDGYIFKRIHPFAGATVRFVVTLDFYRKQPTKGNDMAATWNQPRALGFMNVEHWQGKVNTIEELQAAWDQEDKNLNPGDFNYGKFGGYLNTRAKATDFFRVEQINNRWWFVDPEGHLFLSTSVNGIGPGSTGTSMRGRETIFEELPPQQDMPFGNSPNNPSQNPATNQQQGNQPQNPVINQQQGNQHQSAMVGNRPRSLNYLGWNLQRRYGDNNREKANNMTIRRINAWGFTTGSASLQKPYVTNFRAPRGGTEIMGIPDVYSKAFSDNIEQMAKQQLVPQKDNPWIIGYWIANEPPWPNRESLAVTQILAGPDTDTRRALEAFLQQGDTPERRIEFCKQTFQKYLDIMVGTIRKYDPNHLILGICFGGTPPDYIIKMASIFDIYSLNTYAYRPDPAYLDKISSLSGKPTEGWMAKITTLV